MCCGTYDYTYPTFGGKYQRTNPEYGRVGSIYSDPMADPGVPAITNTQVPPKPKRNNLDDDLEDLGQDDDSSITGFSNPRNSNQTGGSGWR